jgi:prespore-specific regulator
MRQDAWTEEDDRVLAEIILRHIREGSTQLAAFEECAGKLGRTEAACGFRWNAYVRKNNLQGIEIAKAQRKMIKSRSKKVIRESIESDSSIENAELTWNEVIRFLKNQRQEHSLLLNKVRQFERESNHKQSELQDLLVAKKILEHELQRLTAEHEMIKEDYKTLVFIMERARKLTLLSVDDLGEPDLRPRFRMDANGNLERID